MDTKKKNRNYTLTIAVGILVLLGMILIGIAWGKWSYKEVTRTQERLLEKRGDKLRDTFCVPPDGVGTTIVYIDDGTDTEDVEKNKASSEDLINLLSVVCALESEDLQKNCMLYYKGGDENFEAYVDPDVTSTYMEGMGPEWMRVPVWEDADGDRFFVFSRLRYSVPGGLAYYSRNVWLSNEGFAATPCNVVSQDNTELCSVAQELFSGDKSSGLYGDYRYIIVECDPRLPSGEPLSSPLGRYILFMDVSEEMAAWKSSMVKYAGMLCGVWVLITILVFVLETVKNRAMRLAIKEEESEAEGSPDVIKKELSSETSKILLSHIDDAEHSMGPNGYLEALRKEIDQRTKQ